ncbi:MAG TPA: hypothetical protein VGQ81_15760 [Acidobacteriota bacterium]|jgi:SSS family solute:Na+ symporter|nr:hypothetical protein [Acidobacteriota bacterium]
MEFIIRPYYRTKLTCCLYLCLAAAMSGTAKANESDVTQMKQRERAVSILRQALKEGREWEKVHAAEALLWNGYFDNVKETLQAELRKASPSYRIGLWRVLAKAQGNDESAGRSYVEKLRGAFLDAQSPDREYALEALAKLGYSERLDELLRVAKEGKGSFQVRARWVLANSGNPHDEETLADLLESADPGLYGSTGYALRHLKRVQPSTLARLERAASKELDSRSRAYVLSAWYVHSPDKQKGAIKQQLVKYLGAGSKEQKAEVCAALGSFGRKTDAPLLEPLLEDAEVDVRISAANALLRIERRQYRGLGRLDWGVMALYGISMLGIGWYASRKQKSTEEYFVGSRNMKPFTIGISLFATLMSSISYLAHPGEMIKHGPVFLCGLAASPIVYLVVGYALIPFLMRLPVTSAYEILEGRLGIEIRLLGSMIFILTRLVWMALMTYVTARLMVVLLDWGLESLPYVMVAAGLITVVYTAMGGLRGVVITDVVQFFILFGGGILPIVLITYRMGGVGAWFPTSWAPNWDVQPFFSLNPWVRATVVGSVLNSLAFWICTGGSDQMAIQRYLATRDAKAGRRAFLTNMIASVFVTVVLALVGFALLGFFRANPQFIADGQSLIADADYLFPQFIANHLAFGMAGLVVSGIFAAAMSSLSSGINSVSTVFIVDFLDRFRRRKETERHQVSVARWLSFGIGLIVVLISLVIDKIPGNLQEISAKTGVVFMVPLFILFYMALFIRYSTPFGTAFAALYSFFAAALVAFWDVITGQPPLSFQWISIVSLLVGLISGPLLSLIPIRARSWPVLTAWSVLATMPLVIIYLTLV